LAVRCLARDVGRSGAGNGDGSSEPVFCKVMGFDVPSLSDSARVSEIWEAPGRVGCNVGGLICENGLQEYGAQVEAYRRLVALNFKFEHSSSTESRGSSQQKEMK